MIQAKGETIIRRSPADVFAFVVDARNEPTWLAGAESVQKVTPGDVGLGTVFEGRYRGAGRVRLEVVEFEPPRTMTFRARARMVRFDDRITLHDDGSATHLTAVMSAQPVGLMRLVEPLMARTMKRQFAANWDGLRRPLEAAESEPAEPEVMAAEVSLSAGEGAAAPGASIAETGMRDSR